MRLLYLLPAPVSRGPMGSKELVRRAKLLQRRAAPGMEIEVRDTDDGPTTIECIEDELRAIPGTLRAIVAAEQDGFDAAVIGCASDPGIEQARALVAMPVVGPAQASFNAARSLGERFAVLTVQESAVPLIVNAERRCGVEDCCSGVFVIDIPVLKVAEDRSRTIGALIEAGRKAMQSGTDVLVLGCMSIGFLDVADEVSAEVGLPVVCPLTAALQAVETAVNLALPGN